MPIIAIIGHAMTLATLTLGILIQLATTRGAR
jgi:hypothetical protein